MSRSAGASVILVDGRLVAFLRRRNPAIRVMLTEDEPDRSRVARSLAQKLADVALQRQERRSGLLIGSINDAPAGDHFLGRFLEETGFLLTASGYQMRRTMAAALAAQEENTDEDGDDAADA